MLNKIIFQLIFKFPKQIPYPAISICPGTIQNGSNELFTLLQDLHNISYLNYVRHRCRGMWSFNECYVNDIRWKKYELGMHYWLNIQIDYARKYKISTNLTISAFGWCKTFNIIGFDKMFHENSATDYFKYKKMSNFDTKSKLLHLKNNSISSIRKEAGFRASLEFGHQSFVTCQFMSGCNRESVQTTVVIHPQYEMPDTRHKKVVIQFHDFMKISIEPQIWITDETLLELDID